MNIFVDTNILLRSIQPKSAHHSAANLAIESTLKAGHVICVSSQIIYEFFAVATRPEAENGLGLSHCEADSQLEAFLSHMIVFYDSAEVTHLLRKLVVDYQITGKKIHDARIAATMISAGVRKIYSFNSTDFKRFADIEAISPIGLVNAPPE